MEYDYALYQLSDAFREKYPMNQYPELMYKAGRPYNCLLIDIYQDYFICIPFRSHISHNNAFFFRRTLRSKLTRSGLDFSKIVIIKESKFLQENAIVDSDEYTETIRQMPQIVRAASSYVNNYISHINGSSLLHPNEFKRKYRFSTLSYFHDLLGLNRN